MKTCPICKTPNPNDNDICYKCCASLDFKIYDSTNNTKECPNCYAVNDIDVYICNQCGHSFYDLDTKNEKTYKCVHCENDIMSSGKALCSKCNRKKWILKIILFFLACTIHAIIDTTAKMNGYLLGAIPTILILGALFYFANYIPNRIYNNPKRSKVNDNLYVDSLKNISPLNGPENNINKSKYKQSYDIVFKLDGVTIENRQDNLRIIYTKILNKEPLKIRFIKKVVNNKSTIKISVNDLDIGFIPERSVRYFEQNEYTYKAKKIIVNYSKNESNTINYYANLTVNFCKN